MLNKNLKGISSLKSFTKFYQNFEFQIVDLRLDFFLVLGTDQIRCTAIEQGLAADKVFELPIVQFMLDNCGAHQWENSGENYHYHANSRCVDEFFDMKPTGHSTKAGTMDDNVPIYGFWEDELLLPTDLDVCGAHTGITPDSKE